MKLCSSVPDRASFSFWTTTEQHVLWLERNFDLQKASGKRLRLTQQEWNIILTQAQCNVSHMCIHSWLTFTKIIYKWSCPQIKASAGSAASMHAKFMPSSALLTPEWSVAWQYLVKHGLSTTCFKFLWRKKAPCWFIAEHFSIAELIPKFKSVKMSPPWSNWVTQMLILQAALPSNSINSLHDNNYW